MSTILAAPLFASRGQAAVPLGVTIPRLMIVAPGRVLVDVVITGLQPELHPTIEGTATVGSHVIEGPRWPIIAAHLPGVLDLPAGKLRLGGVGAFDFTPVPPLDQNTPMAVEVTVRQGSEAATAHQTATLLLPTLIVPGYLNDLGGKPYSGVISILERRGYRATGASPNLFWFTYPSRSLSLEDGARALATYVRQVVLPSTYATRINVVGYSEGGLLARWNLAFEPGWNQLVNQFVMVGVPNEGVVMAYIDGWYPVLAGVAQTPAARSMLPTFPFWSPAPGAPWSVPSDGRNPSLEKLNSRPLPDGVRVYAMYGNQWADPEGPGTWAGIAGRLPRVQFSYGPGDGIVLTASALGLPINGGAGVPGLADHLVGNIDLGDVGHLSLLDPATPKIADLLIDEGTVKRTGALGTVAATRPVYRSTLDFTAH